MNARKWVSGLTALSLALSSGAFAQTFSQQAPVPDRAHDGDRGEGERSGRDVTRGDIREQQQREQGRDRRNDRDWQRERDAQQRQRDLQQQREWERQRNLQQQQRDWRRDERPDYRGRDMRYERGAGPNHNWYRGGRLPPEYRTRQYIVNDWRGHRLSAPPPGHYWVQSGTDYLLVAIATGVIAQLLLNN